MNYPKCIALIYFLGMLFYSFIVQWTLWSGLVGTGTLPVQRSGVWSLGWLKPHEECTLTQTPLTKHNHLAGCYSNLDSVKYWIHQLNLLGLTHRLGLPAQLGELTKETIKLFLLLFGLEIRKHWKVFSLLFLFHWKTHGIYSINSFPVTHPIPKQQNTEGTRKAYISF